MENKDKVTSRNGLTTAFWLNLCFSLVELAGGLWTQSTAIITDALHDFGDALAIGVGIFLERLSGKRRTSDYSYGYRRFSLLSALLLSLLLLAGAGFMLVKALFAIADPHEVNATGMLWLAVLGLVVNGAAFLRVRQGATSGHHHHHHHHNHHHHHHGMSGEASPESTGHTDKAHHNTRSIMLHLLEDVLGWAAVLVGAVVIRYTGWYWVDPLLSIGIALFIIYNAVKNLTGTLRIFLQGLPEGFDTQGLLDRLQAVEGVADIHDLHLWTMDGSYLVATLHVVTHASEWKKVDAIRAEVEAVLYRHKINHPTVQMESGTRVSCEFIDC